jgi:hypothetical protein
MEKHMAKKTLEELQEQHTEMLASAHDIGLEVPEELRAEFTDEKAGVAICNALDKLIKENVAEDDEGEEGAEAAPPPKAKAPRKAKAKVAAVTTVDEDEIKETKVKAKKAVAKKTTAKKAVAKKAKKTVAAAKKNGNGKAAAANGNGKGRSRFDEDAKIQWVGEEIPGREGTGRYQRIENVKKHGGKTVATYLKSGPSKTLRWCVNNGLAKV